MSFKESRIDLILFVSVTLRKKQGRKNTRKILKKKTERFVCVAYKISFLISEIILTL
jgi:hypothetical protein